jgi:hypothetical protein
MRVSTLYALSEAVLPGLFHLRVFNAAQPHAYAWRGNAAALHCIPGTRIPDSIGLIIPGFFLVFIFKNLIFLLCRQRYGGRSAFPEQTTLAGKWGEVASAATPLPLYRCTRTRIQLGES